MEASHTAYDGQSHNHDRGYVIDMLLATKEDEQQTLSEPRKSYHKPLASTHMLRSRRNEINLVKSVELPPPFRKPALLTLGPYKKADESTMATLRYWSRFSKHGSEHSKLHEAQHQPFC